MNTTTPTAPPLHTETAGSLVTRAIPIVTVGTTVSAVEDLLLKSVHAFDTINYIYVVGADDVLQGVVSVKEVFGAPGDTPLETLTHTPVTVRAREDQERVVAVALQHSIKAVPVVDKDNRLLGVVPSDQILRILQQEHTEDLYRLAGVRRQRGAVSEAHISTLVKGRLPWLLLGLLGGIAAAVVVEQFSEILATELVLAAFIPAVVYIADAVGAQAQLLFIQANSQHFTASIFRYLRRELLVASWVGMILGLLIGAVSYAWLGTAVVSIILGLSVFATVYFSVTVAVLMPWVFHRYGFDPAVASGPLATVVRDISSLGIYLAIAATLLG